MRTLIRVKRRSACATCLRCSLASPATTITTNLLATKKKNDETVDWVKATLDLPLIHEPGTQGSYCSGGVSVVGRMAENATHAYLPDFAQKTLFGPLGISRSQYEWNYNLTNADKEYSQIHLAPRHVEARHPLQR
jgi:CubicO group peptidase (beta-lactamase class C family)